MPVLPDHLVVRLCRLLTLSLHWPPHTQEFTSPDGPGLSAPPPAAESNEIGDLMGDLDISSSGKTASPLLISYLLCALPSREVVTEPPVPPTAGQNIPVEPLPPTASSDPLQDLLSLSEPMPAAPPPTSAGCPRPPLVSRPVLSGAVQLSAAPAVGTMASDMPCSAEWHAPLQIHLVIPGWATSWAETPPPLATAACGLLRHCRT